jgi:hypothetical protein
VQVGSDVQRALVLKVSVRGFGEGHGTRRIHDGQRTIVKG